MNFKRQIRGIAVRRIITALPQTMKKLILIRTVKIKNKKNKKILSRASKKSNNNKIKKKTIL